MRKIILLLIVVFAVSFVGCNKLGTDPSTQSQFVLNTDVVALQDRITLVNEPLQFSDFKSTNASISANIQYRVASAFKANLDYTGAGHDYLSASSIEFDDNKVYIGFHDHGVEFYGEIFVLTDAATGDPTANFAVDSRWIDVNDVAINGSLLWVAGESNKRGAEALTMPIDLSSGLSATTIQLPIFGASGNSITSIGSDVWITTGGDQGRPTGQNGGIIVMNGTTEVFSKHLDNVKHFDGVAGGKGLMVYGNNTTTTVFEIWEDLSDPTTSYYVEYEKSDFANLTTADIEMTVTPYGKNAVDVDAGFAFVALGKAGVFKVDITSGDGTGGGSVIAHYFDAENEGWANGVKTDGTYVYVANGADGLIVLKYADLSYVGRWNGPTLSGSTSVDNGSCNYVDINGTDLYAAFGRGGMVKMNLTITP